MRPGAANSHKNSPRHCTAAEESGRLIDWPSHSCPSAAGNGPSLDCLTPRLWRQETGHGVREEDGNEQTELERESDGRGRDLVNRDAGLVTVFFF